MNKASSDANHPQRWYAGKLNITSIFCKIFFEISANILFQNINPWSTNHSNNKSHFVTYLFGTYYSEKKKQKKNTKTIFIT